MRRFSLLLFLLALTACEREERRFRELPPAAARDIPVRVSVLQPATPLPGPDEPGPYAANAYGISEGKRLYQWYNCSGCHFQGGGGIGPPLMDDQWIYGGEPENIYDTIVEGRPNGMPSYGGHVPDDQVWKIVAYVRSMSGLAPKAAASGRSDHMAARPSEQRKKPEEPGTQEARHPG